MNDPKTQIVEKLKSASNILVTVSASPSVDQLAACIATTLLLTKFKKNATAVFSGKVPGVLNFLNPAETIEKNTDSLRDFIIALDKSKADKLRYKVEDDVVKIFITPYRTSITQRDLKYSAGDFNVDVILALGVQHQQDLDRAITAHGRIFHDAVVMCINNQPNGDFGVANWEDLQASSLSELVAILSNDLDPNLLDANISTALLTGIVAETSRFSNDKTHPGTMEVSSRLLAAGADQQLVNTQLQDLIGTIVRLEAGTEIVPDKNREVHDDSHTDVEEELIIDEHGELKPVQPGPGPGATPAEAAKAEEPKPEEAKPEDPKPEIPEVPAPEPAPEAANAVPETPTEPTPAQPNTTPPVVAVPADLPTDADNARQAIEDALAVSGGSEPPVPAAMPDAQPIQITPPPDPGTLNQPSYANPIQPDGFQMPVTPEHEPAPLGMSPADQAFTMPMPPTSSMPPVPPPAFPGVASEPAQPAGPPPPPLPPPMMPVDLGAQQR